MILSSGAGLRLLARLLLVSGLMLAGPALMAQTHGPAVPATTSETVRTELDETLAHDAPAMPQLDFSTYPSQIFWLAVSFGLLYYLLSRRALPRVADILENRQERITADLDRAARMRRDAEQALETYERIVEEAHANASAAVKAAQERTLTDIAARQAALDRELAAKLGEAEARIGAARDSALAEIADVAAEASQAAVARLAGLDVPAGDARRAVQAVLGEAR